MVLPMGQRSSVAAPEFKHFIPEQQPKLVSRTPF